MMTEIGEGVVKIYKSTIRYTTKCVCSYCGNVKDIDKYAHRAGRIKSCGCLKKKAITPKVLTYREREIIVSMCETGYASASKAELESIKQKVRLP